ncbi:MAG: Hpt domain-containing protein [bacterium]|nr:Hpt domain-containing protein [bacterium]
MKIEDVIDRKQLSTHLDGDMDLYRELADLFIEDSKTLLDNIGAAIKSNDSEALRKTAHTLKGAVSNFSAAKAFEAAFSLEKIGKAGELDEAEAIYETLKNEINTTCEAMELLKKEDSL